MSEISPLNSTENKATINPKMKSPLKPFIIPFLITFLFVLWKFVLSSNGILKPLPWMEKWGEAMLVLGLGLWLLFLLTPYITRFSKANKFVKAGLPLLILAALLVIPLIQIKTGALNYWLYMLTICFMYIIWSSSWNIIGGYAGYISLGHTVFIGIGAYFAGMIFVFWRISPFITAPVAG